MIPVGVEKGFACLLNLLAANNVKQRQQIQGRSTRPPAGLDGHITSIAVDAPDEVSPVSAALTQIGQIRHEYQLTCWWSRPTSTR